MAEIIQKTMDHDSESFPEITRRNGPVIRAIIEHIAKALTYINMPDARRMDCKEGTMAAKALAAIKTPAKREKAQRKAAALVQPDYCRARPESIAGVGSFAWARRTPPLPTRPFPATGLWAQAPCAVRYGFNRC